MDGPPACSVITGFSPVHHVSTLQQACASAFLSHYPKQEQAYQEDLKSIVLLNSPLLYSMGKQVKILSNGRVIGEHLTQVLPGTDRESDV